MWRIIIINRMKKHFAIALIAIAACVAACDKNKANGGKTDDPASEEFKKGGTVLSPTEQQQKIENASLKAVDMLDPKAFEPSANLIRFFVENYLEADLSAIEEAFGAKIESAYQYDESTEDYGTWLYVRTFESMMLDLSQYTGKITANSTKWTYEPADKLSLHFKDENGADCIIEMAAKGNLGTVPVVDSYDSFYEYYPDVDGDGRSDYEYIYTESESTVYSTLPEELNISLKQAGTAILEAEYKLKTNALETEDIDAIKLEFSASFFFSGYKAEVKKVYFDGKAAEVTTAISILDKVVVSESVKVSDIELNLNDELVIAKGKFESKLNLLGEVQIAVKVPDVRKLMEVLAKEGSSEAEIKALCDELNGTFTAEIHFDNTSAVQANIKLGCFVDESGNIDLMPILVFPDGSSYAIDEYITENFLEKLDQKIQKIFEEIEAIVGE